MARAGRLVAVRFRTREGHRGQRNYPRGTSPVKIEGRSTRVERAATTNAVARWRSSPGTSGYNDGLTFARRTWRNRLDPILLSTALALLGASAVGAALPLFRRWSERGLHLFVALSAGIFLGTIFFHLLPHLAGVGHEDSHGHAPGAEEIAHSVWPWGAALLGILLLFLLEKVWLPSRTREAQTNPHALLWSATYAGLALHAATAGVALSGILEMPEGRAQFLVSILVHKATECFSLATVMRLAGLPTGRSIALLALFALIEPAGLLVSGELAHAIPAAAPILTGFACGTFLYVAVADLLPEVFHGAGRARWKIAAVLAGVALPTLTLERVEHALAFARSALVESAGVFLEMAPYLLLGFALAGVVRLWLRPERVAPKLGGNDLRSVGWAALIGAPLPLCSCSVIPVAMSLRKAGASKGATSAFTVSTPETGVDSLAVTWALLDPFMTVARPIGALVSAVTAGSAVNWLVRRGWDASPASAGATRTTAGDHERAPAAVHACCAHEPAPSVPARTEIASEPVVAPDAGVRVDGDAPVVGRSSRFLPRALRFGFVDMLDDLAPSLLVGLLVSGVIVAALPAGALEDPIAHGPLAYFVMLLIGVPLYVCAAASTPIAAALMLKGLSPGAAFVFLLAGPATNAASLVVLSRVLGVRVVVVQVAALSICAVALGVLVDRIHGWMGLTPTAVLDNAHHHEHGTPWLSYVSAALLAVLLIASLLRTHGRRDLLAAWRERPSPA